jgi:tripartite-type tricarboxylate transporter receptor subunit TctC
MKKALLAALCVAWALYGGGAAYAQVSDYPNRPIKVVIPFPPGGPTDGMARIISERLNAVLGQPIVVENRGGAGGGVGGKFVAEADPDGYTLLMTPGGALTTGPALHKDIGYDPEKAFAPVSQLSETPLIVSVNPALPIKSLADVITYAKANPGKLNWGTQGIGTAPSLLCELFKLETGVNIVQVPYRGTGPMLVAALAGEVQMIADPSTTSLPDIKAGKLRPIAIAGSTRDPELPDAPAGTPLAIINKLNTAFRDAMNDPVTVKHLQELDTYVKTGSPENFRKMLASELALWSGVVKAAHIQAE